MPDALGAFGETYATGYLARQGYAILEHNVRYRCGEIDIVARDGQTLVFVEVKCRRSTRFGSPEASITARRFDRLRQAIETFVQERGLDSCELRVDVMAILVDSAGHVRRAELIRGVEAPAP